MLAISNALRHLVSRTYLAGSKELTGSMLRGCSGARYFSRVIVVSALGRNNGITSGEPAVGSPAAARRRGRIARCDAGGA